MNEEWRDVLGFEHLYEVSNLGRVRTKYSGQIRKAVLLASGYLHLQLYQHNRGHGRYVHRLVLEAFKGACPKDMESRHLDGVKTNCCLDNLDWGTSQQNSADTLLNGNHAQAKLSDDLVRALRQGDHIPIAKLAIELGITEVTLHNAKSGRTYQHVGDVI